MKEIDSKQIDAWKKAHGDVFKVEVDGKVCYLKKPDRKVLGAASVLGKNDPMKYNEVLLENCWLDGDEEIKKDDSLFLGVSSGDALIRAYLHFDPSDLSDEEWAMQIGMAEYIRADLTNSLTISLRACLR